MKRAILQMRLAAIGWATAAVLAFAPLASAEPTQAPTAPAFTYLTPTGTTFTVTAEGLSSIRNGEHELAHGGWSCFNAEEWFKDSGSKAVKTSPVREKSLVILDARHARVRQAAGDVVCTTDYTFEGEDVTLSSRVENNHPTSPMNVTGFGGLTFSFDRPPDGLMPVQHITYFQAHGVSLCHPSYWSPVGGSYATDDHVGVGVSPWNTGLTRTLILWDYADWNQDKREKLPQRRLLYFVVNPAPPRGANTFDFKIRVSPNRDWKHLLEPYRDYFRSTYGPVQYHSDYRWIATDYLNRDQQAISPTNPYGFYEGARRIDLAEGVKSFCDTVIPALQGSGGQGVVVWGQGGDDPRGAMYRPDFDILPPEVEANWTTLAKRFKDAGLKIGVATRPADMAVRQDWKHDEIISINPDDPGHREMLWRRFRTMIDRGCTLFYLDSFGSQLEDVKLMQYLRQQMGPTVLTFAEHQCDALLPYSGGYSETTLHGNATPPGYTLWSGLETWKIYEWLAPGSQMSGRLYQIEGKAPPELEGPDQFFYQNRITPLVPVSDFKRLVGLKDIQARYLGPDGAWAK